MNRITDTWFMEYVDRYRYMYGESSTYTYKSNKPETETRVNYQDLMKVLEPVMDESCKP